MYVVCDVTLLLALVKFVQLLYVQSTEAFPLPHNGDLVPTDQSLHNTLLKVSDI